VIPQLLTVRVERPDGRPFRVWVPILPIALAISPVVAVAVPVACLVHRVSVAQALRTGWRVVSALPGTQVELEHGGTAVHVGIR
jgi:hypothetical protein